MSAQEHFKLFKGKIYFEAGEPVFGRELWSTDGTASGTTLVADINPGSSGSYPAQAEFMTEFNGRLCFGAKDEAHGSEMWCLVPDHTAPLPSCGCDNFRNGLTTDHAGERACVRSEVHGLTGAKTWCMLPPRPYIPHLDDGCTSDTTACFVTHTAPIVPLCECDQYVNGASSTSPDGLCEKTAAHGEKICRPPNYAVDEKIGGSGFFGCSEDTRYCNSN